MVQVMAAPPWVTPRAPWGEHAAPSVTPWTTVPGADVAGVVATVVVAAAPVEGVNLVVGLVFSSSSPPHPAKRAKSTIRMQARPMLAWRWGILMCWSLPTPAPRLTLLPWYVAG